MNSKNHSSCETDRLSKMKEKTLNRRRKRTVAPINYFLLLFNTEIRSTRSFGCHVFTKNYISIKETDKNLYVKTNNGRQKQVSRRF